MYSRLRFVFKRLNKMINYRLTTFLIKYFMNLQLLAKRRKAVKDEISYFTALLYIYVCVCVCVFVCVCTPSQVQPEEAVKSRNM